MVSDLQEIGLLVKNAGKISVNPRLLLDFTNILTVQITIYAPNRQTS
jgi:hypothetical protein